MNVQYRLFLDKLHMKKNPTFLMTNSYINVVLVFLYHKIVIYYKFLIFDIITNPLIKIEYQCKIYLKI